MKKLTLDFTGVNTYWGFYERIIEALELRKDCGKGPDAVWDFMKDYCDNVHVTVIGIDRLSTEMANEVNILLQILEDAASGEDIENFHFTIAEATPEQ